MPVPIYQEFLLLNFVQNKFRASQRKVFGDFLAPFCKKGLETGFGAVATTYLAVN